jgi:hypothetical protein
MIKIKFILTANLLSVALICKAQLRADYPIKEQYEKLHYGAKDPYVHDDEIYPVYGDNYSYRLESMIRMYETIGDKAYLIKFVNNH